MNQQLVCHCDVPRSGPHSQAIRCEKKVRLPLGKIKLHLCLKVPCPCCHLVVRVVGVAVVGVEVVLPLQRVLGADPSLAAADGKVLQPELPVAA